MITLTLCSLMSLALAVYIVYKPLIKDPEEVFHLGNKNEPHRFSPKLALLETLSELEQDYQLGHLSKEEFEQLQLEYQRDYLASTPAIEQQS